MGDWLRDADASPPPYIDNHTPQTHLKARDVTIIDMWKQRKIKLVVRAFFFFCFFLFLQHLPTYLPTYLTWLECLRLFFSSTFLFDCGNNGGIYVLSCGLKGDVCAMCEEEYLRGLYVL